MLSIIVGEHHPFTRDAVDVGRLEAQQAVGVGADVGLTDVVAPDDDDVGLLLLCAAAGKLAVITAVINGSRPSHIFLVVVMI